jgi:hypothetical protein
MEDFNDPILPLPIGGSPSLTASRDYTNRFNGKPTCKLDTQGFNSGVTGPSTVAGPNANGLQLQVLMSNSGAGVFGFEGWFRFTSANWVLNANEFFAVRMYTRDGSNSYHAVLWPNPQAAVLGQIQILDGVSHSYKTLGTIPFDDYLVTNDPMGSGSTDNEGIWHYFQLIVDFNQKAYLLAQVDEQIFSINGATSVLTITPDTGPRIMHWGVEIGANNTGRRFMNVANLRAFELL